MALLARCASKLQDASCNRSTTSGIGTRASKRMSTYLQIDFDEISSKSVDKSPVDLQIREERLGVVHLIRGVLDVTLRGGNGDLNTLDAQLDAYLA